MDDCSDLPAGEPAQKGEATVQLTPIEGGADRIMQETTAARLIAECLAAYEGGSVEALYDLGVAFSTGSHGARPDMIEAHKWFNIAASRGHEESAWCRADVSEEMTAREIAEAQRRAREWLAQGHRRAA